VRVLFWRRKTFSKERIPVTYYVKLPTKVLQRNRTKYLSFEETFYAKSRYEFVAVFDMCWWANGAECQRSSFSASWRSIPSGSKIGSSFSAARRSLSAVHEIGFAVSAAWRSVSAFRIVGPHIAGKFRSSCCLLPIAIRSEGVNSASCK